MSSKKSDTRKALLEAANRLLRKGSGEVRLEDVASAAGVSRQTVYLHFGSRMGLFEALAAYIDAQYPGGDAAPRISAAADAVGALDRLIEYRADYIAHVHAAVQPVLEARKTDPAARAAYTSRQSARRKDYALVIDRLAAEGLLAEHWDTDTAVDVLRVLLSIPTWEQFVVESKWSRKRYVRHLKELLHRTLLQS